jgi:sterol desaturase/sphingolipid hydroxylase (fatty acid hydroxylase superfamily)
MFEYLEYLGLACIPAFLVLDLVHRKRDYATPRYWRLYGTVVTVVIVGVSMGVAALWGEVLAGYSLFDGQALGIVGGAVVGIFVYELIHYGYHRLAHEWTPLWRLGHQVHHSAESLDAFGANYQHPIDAAFFTTWSSLVFFPLLGLMPEAGILGAAFLGFNAMFQHANIATPRWLGYFIQRPESHCVHHAQGVHRYNYADLPIVDMIFGTFRNPETVDGMAQGFRNGDSARYLEMLAFKDVSGPPGEESAMPSGSRPSAQAG